MAGCIPLIDIQFYYRGKISFLLIRLSRECAEYEELGRFPLSEETSLYRLHQLTALVST
jgi:hypothetical protein